MLEVEICQMKMRNPTLLAAGVMGSTASSLNWAANSGAGGVVTKSFGLEPNKGYPNPTTVEVEGGIINAIGLSNPGMEVFQEELKKLEGNVPQIASIYGATPEEFSQIARKVDNIVDALELNVSCPHAMEGCGASIGQDPDLTTQIVNKVKKSVKSPVIVKLTPNVTDIVEIARAAESGGADALTLINSLGPGMRIDLETARPVLANRFGGMSGPAIKPIALRCVYQVHQEVSLPIMGVGGIRDHQDVVEFLYAGASCVQIGTAIMYHGLDIFQKINMGLLKFMEDKGYQKVEEMVGLAHEL
ncbi:dihydroorotate dehydrogenase [Methanobacterium petrolearium]|uniref:dihydroorotate dehydrogenase n=1 Tax=Methanobacterium petrolearium TaxID=710190 RepID=UPI001AE5D35A|nr:dihydroorotate dehydrogenase [Methanobacterium petrolearium]MBP1946784.1 dihydroorotate dehydrogenase (NAD+) catalytic subunit [Methanobacterium petrolearium]BDZ69755.1 dihydroorotate dehydrogenase [Methanobacterium petrolearium]